MDNTRLRPDPQTLSPCGSGRRSSVSKSPEFEFWMVRNPSFPQPNLLSADQLFVDGVLLPLHLLPHPHPHSHSDPPDSNPGTDPKPPKSEPPKRDSELEPGLGPELSPVTTQSTNGLTASKRWKDIFKKNDKKSSTKNQEDKGKDKKGEKKKKKERKSGSGASSAELNINIWPFARSRSAGNNNTRPRMVSGAPGTLKVSSAPCSRSNSAGESKYRKWSSSPGRAGVHLGRSSPVWQVRRGGSGLKGSEPVVRNAANLVSTKEGAETRGSKAVGGRGGGGGDGSKSRALNLNVPMCIGYRHNLICRSDKNSSIGNGNGNSICSGSGGDGGGGGNVGSGGNLFNLRSLFTKKVH